MPDTGVPAVSNNVTVTVDDEDPSFATDPGTAMTVEVIADTGPWKVTWAFWDRRVLSVASVAL